jgi:NAD(P) transhydrogenase subunit beta
MVMGFYEIVSAAVVVLVLLGIRLLSSPKTAVAGNRIGALAMLGAIVAVLVHRGTIDLPLIIAALIVGGIIGAVFAARVTMLKIPQLVALLNGFGGLASLLVAFVVLYTAHDSMEAITMINIITAQIAIAVGGITFSGSMIAAGKLDKRISQLPLAFRGQSALSVFLLLAMIWITVAAAFADSVGIVLCALAMIVLSTIFGVVFAVRIGGADMPITISLLNSLSGLAASVCGFAVGDVLLIAVGAVVGASGLILTRIMCRAMNRSLADILTGMTSVAQDTRSEIITPSAEKGKAFASEEETFAAIANILAEARSVIVVPGYGMALAQAQNRVKELYDLLEQKGVSVKFAIHPVAGRMPGHMNVLLAEVDVPYEKLFELDDINPEFSSTDAVLVVGACDVVNPMAITAEGTPIYGMPILHVHEAKHVIVCNLDEKPGYSGVQNPLYEKEHVILAFGNAEETIGHIVRHIRSA